MQFHEDKQTRRDRLNSLLKCSILRNLMFLIDRNSHFYMYLEKVLGHFGHRHFGLGRFGLDISATDVSATENAEGGHFGQNHKFWV